ncbi:MAG TPA: hypothetical protein ENN17_00955 [bacterium]|mgnify:CR=1 FL=1|nr:hypothetical protein [bacterium]
MDTFCESVVKRHRTVRLAVFDVDWTLFVGTSAETLLINYLKTVGWFRPAGVGRGICYALRTLPHGVIEAFLKNKYYLSGLDAESLLGRMDEFHEEWMKPRLSASMLDQLSRYREKGYELVLLSGTLDFIIRTLCGKLDIGNGIGSRVEIRDSKFTGRVEGMYPIHAQKIILLKRHFAGCMIDWSECAAFGDSYWDIPLLSRVGRPMAVHPDIGLFREAVRRGWPIERRTVEITSPAQRLWIEQITRRQKSISKSFRSHL